MAEGFPSFLKTPQSMTPRASEYMALRDSIDATKPDFAGQLGKATLAYNSLTDADRRSIMQTGAQRLYQALEKQLKTGQISSPATGESRPLFPDERARALEMMNDLRQGKLATRQGTVDISSGQIMKAPAACPTAMEISAFRKVGF